jgi:hypothetical protein
MGAPTMEEKQMVSVLDCFDSSIQDLDRSEHKKKNTPEKSEYSGQI